LILDEERIGVIERDGGAEQLSGHPEQRRGVAT